MHLSGRCVACAFLLGACRGTETVAPELGTLRVAASMTGVDIDRDGVVITVDTARPVAIPSNGSYEFTNLVVGPHTVRLGGVTANCTSAAPLERSVMVSARAPASVTFALACTKVPLAASGIIAFARGDVDHTFDLWLMNPDGTGETKVRDSPNVSDLLPSWTADGRRIVFVAAGGIPSRIVVIDRSGAGFTELTSGSPPTYTPSVSPDGRLIAYSQQKSGSDYDLWVMNIDGTSRRQLTSDPGYEDHPTWSPDGVQIAFARDGGIYRVNADGTNVQRLSPPSATTDRWPAWSPDGALIAFSRTMNEPAHIYTMRPDGTQVTQLTTGLDGDEDPAWSPDGTRIAFGSGRGGTFAIWSMRSDGSDLRRISSGAYESQPAWSH
jgi:TolB protein